MDNAPIYKFTNADVFATRHREATIVEFEIERQRVDEFNSLNCQFRAWVIKKSPWNTYTVLADLAGMKNFLPRVGQRFKIRFTGEEEGATWFSCCRETETIELGDHPGLSSSVVEIEIEVPPGANRRLRSLMAPLGQFAKSGPVKLPPSRMLMIRVKLRVSTTTMDAELGALFRLTQGTASKKSLDTFAYLLRFGKPRWVVNFFVLYPHLKNLAEIPATSVRDGVRRGIDRFDTDQKAAFEGLSALKSGVCFVPGGPGAGKTTWSLTVATAAQAGMSQVKVLLLVDINKTADDAANRVQAIYNKLGLKKSVIRLRTWAKVRSKRDRRNNQANQDEEQDSDSDGSQGDSDDDSDIGHDPEHEEKKLAAMERANFTKGFLAAFGQPPSRNPGLAPTLDHAAWNRFCLAFPDFNTAHLAVLDAVGGEPHTLRWRKKHREPFRQSLIPLYQDTISEADFIVTTPAAARSTLVGLYKPDIIVVDECGHARELSTMIALAYFKPKAFFFTGDHRQTEPYVEAHEYHGHARQLKISTMERAAINDATPYQLLVNHRAHGGLERLASGVFYRGMMRSDKIGQAAFPHSTVNLQIWLQDLAGRPLATPTPRLLIADKSSYSALQIGTSFYNPKHQALVVKEVARLLADSKFIQPGVTVRPGTIMIISPYREAVSRYRAAVNKNQAIHRTQRHRVQILTTDTAQGQEADVVFFDMVKDRPTQHVLNPKRLCVALTRARQAEVILMREQMAARTYDNGESGGYLSIVWQRCAQGVNGTLVEKSL